MALTRISFLVALMVAAVALNDRNAIDDAIIRLLESLRGIIPNPVAVQQYQLVITGNLSLNGTFRNLEIGNLGSFVVNSVSNNIDQLEANFSISVPEINIAGLYDMVGNIQDFFDLFGNGPFTLLVRDLKTDGAVRIASADGTNNSPLSLSSVNISFSVSTFQTNFTNLNGGGELGDTLNSIISDVGPEFIQDNQADLASTIAASVASLVDPYLATCTLQDLLDYLGVQPQPMQTRDNSTCILYQIAPPPLILY